MPRQRMLIIAGSTIVGLVVLAAVAWLLIRFGPEQLTNTDGLGPSDSDAARGRVRTALLAVAAGVIAAIGAIYTARTYELNRRGQITERFTRAIEQLASDRLEVRLGGIYALERIAIESADEHGPIVGVLTAYVRTNSPWDRQDPETAHIHGTASAAPPRAPVDIAAIVAVLARRKPRRDREPDIDLSYTNLTGVQAYGIDLSQANLYGTQLRDAILDDANLNGANLDAADLIRATLLDVDLRQASLRGAWLQSVHAYHADMRNARFEGADLDETNLHAADMRGASFHGATFTNSSLEKTRFEGATAGGSTQWPDDFDWRAAGVEDVLNPTQ